MSGMVKYLDVSTGAGPLSAALHLPEVLPAPAVICSHGLLSSKDSVKLTTLGEELSALGLAALRFDYSGCGESTAREEESILGTRLRDLLAMIGFVRGSEWASGVVSLLGSSLGGYLSLLAADALNCDHIGAVVCWATPFDLAGVRGAMEEYGRHEALASYRGPLGSPMRLDRLPPIPRVLVLHGESDELVPWRDGGEIYRSVATEPKEFVLLRGVEHRFLDDRARGLAVSLSCEWILAHCVTHYHLR